MDNAGGDIFAFFTGADMAYDLRLRKNCAHSTDSQWLSVSGHFIHFIQISSQTGSHDFNELAGTGGTFVIHQKICHLSINDFDHLGVLAAHINNGHIFLKNGPSTFAVAGDFRNNFVGIIYTDAAVAGGHAAHGVGIAPGFQLFQNGIGCFTAVPSCGQYKIIFNFTIL